MERCSIHVWLPIFLSVFLLGSAALMNKLGARYQQEIAEARARIEAGKSNEHTSTTEAQLSIQGSSTSPHVVSSSRLPSEDESEAARRSARIRELQIEIRRSDMMRVYGPLFSSLRLTSEHMNEILDLLEKHRSLVAGALRRARSRSGGKLSETDRAEMEQILANQSSELKLLLGEDGFVEFEHAKREAPARQLINDVVASSFDSDTPFTREQGDRLAKLITAYTVPDNTAGGNHTNWDDVYSQLPDFLTASQIEVLRLSQERAEYYQLQRKSARASRSGAQ